MCVCVTHVSSQSRNEDICVGVTHTGGVCHRMCVREGVRVSVCERDSERGGEGERDRR